MSGLRTLTAAVLLAATGFSAPVLAQGRLSTSEDDRRAAEADAARAISDLSDGFVALWAEAERSPLYLEPEAALLDDDDLPPPPWTATARQRAEWSAMPPREEGLVVPPGTSVQDGWQDWYRFTFARANDNGDRQAMMATAKAWLAWHDAGYGPPDVFDNPVGEYLNAILTARNALAPDIFSELGKLIPDFDQLQPGAQLFALARFENDQEAIRGATRAAVAAMPKVERDFVVALDQTYMAITLDLSERSWDNLALFAGYLATVAELENDPARADTWRNAERTFLRNQQINRYVSAMRFRHQNVQIGGFGPAVLFSRVWAKSGRDLFEESDPRRLAVELSVAGDYYGANLFDQAEPYLAEARRLCEMQSCGDLADLPITERLSEGLIEHASPVVANAFVSVLSGAPRSAQSDSKLAALSAIPAAESERLRCYGRSAAQFAPGMDQALSPELDAALQRCDFVAGKAKIEAYDAAGENPATVAQFADTLLLAGLAAYDLGEDAEAEAWLARSMEVSAASGDTLDPLPLSALVSLAVKAGKWADAEARNERLAALVREQAAAGTIDALDFYNYLRAYDGDRVSIQLGRPETAARAFGLAADRAQDERDSRQARSGILSEEKSFERRLAFNSQFVDALDASWARYSAETGGVELPFSRWDSLETGFAAMQDALTDKTSIALAHAIAEQGFPGITPEVQRLIARRRALVEQDVASAGVLYADSLDASQADRFNAARRNEFRQIDAQIEELAPDYFRLVRPLPLDLARASDLLGEREAALLILPGDRGTHVMLVNREGVQWHVSPWTGDEIAERVRRLRWFLGDGDAARDEDEAETWALEVDGGANGFDRDTAFALYRELIAPVAGKLEGLDNLTVVAGGAMSSLPLSVLVTRPPEGRDDDPAALRRTAWFGDVVPLAYLPSLQSLAYLRAADAPTSPRGDAVLLKGFGDPVLSSTTGESVQVPAAAAPVRTLARGGLQDPATIRASFADLPGTRAELQTLAQRFGDARVELFLGEENTERQFKQVAGSSTGVVVVATHAVVAGELRGANEPGLIFTPPGAASSVDDGFLSSSEILQLRMDTDWVVLSACNTAATDGTSGAAGLSGLARAFFYAGARSLLVTHWPLRDDAAPVLTLETIGASSTGQPTSRASALQQAAQRVREDRSLDGAFDRFGTDQTLAHPAVWAPFVYVGDGLLR